MLQQIINKIETFLNRISSYNTYKYFFSPSNFTITTILFSLILSFSCSTTPKNIKLPEPVFSKDCTHNKYFIKDLCNDELKYLDWAESYQDYPSVKELTNEKLRLVSNKYGIDEAAALLYSRILRDPKNLNLYQYIEKQKPLLEKKIPDLSQKNLSLVFIPGLFYEKNKEFDSEGFALRKLAESLGYKTKMIRIKQTGSVYENADIICTYLNQTTAEKVIFTTLSKGASDLKIAISLCGKEPYFQKVVGWFNIVGLVKGSPLANSVEEHWYSSFFWRMYAKWNNYDYKGLLTIQTGPSTPLDIELNLPTQIKLINVLAIPIRRTVSERAMPYYDEMAVLGPNDGMGVLADMYVPYGYTYASWRNDHYFFQPMSEQLILSLLIFMAEGK